MQQAAYNIAPEDHKQSISRAALIVGIDRSNLYRSYINKGEITVSKGIDGTKSIAFDELVRVFGLEKCLFGLNRLNNMRNSGDRDASQRGATPDTAPTVQDDVLSLKIDNARLEAEMRSLKLLLDDRHATIAEQREQLRKHFDELQATRRLLEDKQAKATPSSLLNRLKSLFFQ